MQVEMQVGKDEGVRGQHDAGGHRHQVPITSDRLVVVFQRDGRHLQVHWRCSKIENSQSGFEVIRKGKDSPALVSVVCLMSCR